MKKVVFISDLDGTLIPHPEGIQEKDIETIREHIQQGMTFCIATGRHIEDVTRHEELLEMASYIITNNGSEVYEIIDQKETKLIHKGPTLSLQIVNEIFEIAKDHQVYRTIATSTQYICENSTEPHLALDLRSESISCIRTAMKENGLEATKMCFIGEPTAVQDLYDILTHYYADHYDITISADVCVDVNVKGANKGNGIRFLKHYLQLAEDMIIGAVGDSGNDISMAPVTHFTFAMEGGSQHLKEVANHIVPSVAEAIKKIATIHKGESI